MEQARAGALFLWGSCCFFWGFVGRVWLFVLFLFLGEGKGGFCLFLCFVFCFCFLPGGGLSWEKKGVARRFVWSWYPFWVVYGGSCFFLFRGGGGAGGVGPSFFVVYEGVSRGNHPQNGFPHILPLWGFMSTKVVPS